MNPGGNTIAPTSPAPNTEGGESRKRLTYQQQKKRGIVKLLVFLLLQTVIFSAINFYQVHRLRAQGLPSGRVAIASSESDPVEYQARAEWDSGADANKGSFPRLLLDGKPLPCAFSVPPTKGKVQFLPLRLELEDDCRRGLTKGILYLQPIKAGTGTRNEAKYSISFQVKSLGEQWALVRYWLILLGVAYALMYAWCVFVYARPSGKLAIKLSNESQPRFIGLRMAWAAWVFPWQRDTLSLSWVRKRWPKVLQLASHEGALYFDRYLPPLLELSRPNECVRCLDPRPSRAPQRLAGWPCGSHTPLHDTRAVVFWDPKPTVSAMMFHEPTKRRFAHG